MTSEPLLVTQICPHCGHRAGSFTPTAVVTHRYPKNRNRLTRYQPEGDREV